MSVGDADTGIWLDTPDLGNGGVLSGLQNTMSVATHLHCEVRRKPVAGTNSASEQTSHASRQPVQKAGCAAADLQNCRHILGVEQVTRVVPAQIRDALVVRRHFSA
jgi:hypothetical protein